ncbi:MAG: hypothetical protein J6U93_06635 [Alistipes sp.]|nr:hypothetical protein [Alistipes sp.]
MALYVWTATFEYMGEQHSVEIYNREQQPAEFEFLNLVRERMRNRIDFDSSRLRLMSITKR